MTSRIGKLTSLAEAVEAVGFAMPSSLTSMTDEEWEAHDARVAAERAALVEYTAPRRPALIANGFPRRALEESATADETRSAIMRVKTWLKAPEGVLVIAGGKGCGKTVAAAWWAMRLGSVATFIRAASFAAASRYERSDRDALLGAPALVLDDLGAEYVDAKGSFLVDLDELIDVFYGDRKPLLITTNCAIDVFRSRYGERIVDRIRECGAFFSIAEQSLRGERTTTRSKP